jgi:DNA repair protein RadC
MKTTLENFSHMLPVQRCIAGEDLRFFSDSDLLALIIGIGHKDMDVLDVSTGILKKFGGLQGIYNAGIRELTGSGGIGYVKAIRIRAAFEIGKRLITHQNSIHTVNSADHVWKLLRSEMTCLKQEEFRVLVLNNKNHLIKKCTVSVGTLSEAIIHPREVYREAIRESGSAIIVAHNHPSGVLVPSAQDIDATRRIKHAGEIIGIEMLDHIIIGHNAYLSLRESGYL